MKYLVMFNFFVTLPILASDYFPNWIMWTVLIFTVCLAVKSGIGGSYGKD